MVPVRVLPRGDVLRTTVKMTLKTNSNSMVPQPGYPKVAKLAGQQYRAGNTSFMSCRPVLLCLGSI